MAHFPQQYYVCTFLCVIFDVCLYKFFSSDSINFFYKYLNKEIIAVNTPTKFAYHFYLIYLDASTSETIGNCSLFFQCTTPNRFLLL